MSNASPRNSWVESNTSSLHWFRTNTYVSASRRGKNLRQILRPENLSSIFGFGSNKKPIGLHVWATFDSKCLRENLSGGKSIQDLFDLLRNAPGHSNHKNGNHCDHWEFLIAPTLFVGDARLEHSFWKVRRLWSGWPGASRLLKVGCWGVMPNT